LESVKFETQPGLGYRRSFFISTSGTIVDRPYTLLNFVNDIWFQWARGGGGISRSTSRICDPCRKGRHSDCTGLPCECAKNEHEVV